ncbi:hypothetical protein TNCV_5068301 [Trichonephila clavipes]|nr:hypothetical protein TNCV_5068301 [Trichonephila clavipes]
MYIYKVDSVAVEVSSRPKLTGIVRVFTSFAQTSDRLPRLTQTYQIMPKEGATKIMIENWVTSIESLRNTALWCTSILKLTEPQQHLAGYS